MDTLNHSLIKQVAGGLIDFARHEAMKHLESDDSFLSAFYRMIVPFGECAVFVECRVTDWELAYTLIDVSGNTPAEMFATDSTDSAIRALAQFIKTCDSAAAKDVFEYQSILAA